MISKRRHNAVLCKLKVLETQKWNWKSSSIDTVISLVSVSETWKQKWTCGLCKIIQKFYCKKSATMAREHWIDCYRTLHFV